MPGQDQDAVTPGLDRDDDVVRNRIVLNRLGRRRFGGAGRAVRAFPQGQGHA